MNHNNVNDFRGLWKRTKLFEPLNSTHTSENGKLVLWFQSPCGIFIDLRVYLESIQIHTTKSFSGRISFDYVRNLLTWTRFIDYRLPGTPGNRHFIEYL